MRFFLLNRQVDETGVSGTGIVAEGVQFHDGQCVLSWFGRYHSIEIWPSITDLITIHGHGGKSVVEWQDSMHTAPTPQRSPARPLISKEAPYGQ